MEEDNSDYVNIRQIIGNFIGKRLVDITQHDKEEWEKNKESYVMLMFDDGNYMKFIIGEDGFSATVDDDEEGDKVEGDNEGRKSK